MKSMLLDDKSTHYLNFDIIIQDFGTGMSLENLGTLFLNFNKLEDTSGMNKYGIGLGLSICKNLIEQMGGKVSVSSKLNKGTIFTINFKAACVLDEKSFFFEQ